MLESPFFTQFLKASNVYTFIALALMVIAIFIMKGLTKKKVSFSKRMMIGLAMGLIIGIGIDFFGSSHEIYETAARTEIKVWYAVLGTGFIKLVQLLAVPVVFLSIIKVITDVDGKKIKTLTFKTFVVLLGTTAISALVGILVVKLFNLQGASFVGTLSDSQIDRMSNIAAQSFPEFFVGMIPNNIIASFGSNGEVVSVVLIGALFASAIRFLSVKKPTEIKPFVDFLDSARVAVNSVLINVIKLMPYGVMGLVANTIVANGLAVIKEMGGFIVALYTAVLIMLVVYVILLALIGVNPIKFYKKAFSTMVFAFSSRSSVGTLPYTLKTLEEDMGVSSSTSNFVATLGTSIGMNGCAGVFPAMLATLVASTLGVTMDLPFYIMIVVVVTIGSIGIAGVPGTATVAATVTLNGLGLGEAISSVGAVFGIDPIIDMGRTMLNVTGSMVAAIVVDTWDGTFNKEEFNA